ncbi:hypothetical protein M0D21_15050 [Aquimarina sp. D1M17]|uniref:hypothetical protein n=1 Tax=Aquimarina acroporae TaxID=2937283 RepID=UPI0020BD73EF|nr:hypothetical protein [Aquimarina acroporae]MCK8522894.1 hypothetical protein [Aquimarina acroporae]
MDELELLKKEWKKQEGELPKLSYDQIYRMILKKSSSMVKWLFIICVLEFILWMSIDVIVRFTGDFNEFEEYNLKGFMFVSTIFSYGILLYFILRFYRNYKRIQTTDSAKVLMQNILKTRKTVKYYVWINLSFLTLTALAVVGYLATFTDAYVVEADQEKVPIFIIIISAIIVLSIFVGLVALFYRVIYGILTRRLKRNYEELKKLEL